MRTLKEVNEAKVQQRIDNRNVHRDRVLAILAEAESKVIPIYVDPDSGSHPRDRSAWLKKYREQIREMPLQHYPADVVCDHCELEMLTDGSLLLSNPPCRKVVCVGCCYSGYLR